MEKEAGAQQLEAFVCKEATEANDLMQELRQKFSKMSVIHGDLSKMGQFEGPRGERWRQRPPPDQLGRHSFVAYVSDMFQGPEAVKVHLYMHTSVFSTAVFGPDSSSSEITESFPDLRNYYLRKKLNTCRRSKYSGLISRGEEDISYYKAQRLRVCADQEEIRGQERQVEELTAKLETNKRELARLGDTVEENRKEMKAVKAEIAHISQGRVEKQKLEIGLTHKQELVEQLSQPTNAHFHDERVEYRGKRKQGALELVRLAQVIKRIRFSEFTNAIFQAMQEDQAKAPLQAAEREVLYLQQFHLGQVYSENSSQLAALRQVRSSTNRNCPDEWYLSWQNAIFAELTIPLQELTEQEAALGPEERRLDQWKDQQGRGARLHRRRADRRAGH